MLSLLTAFFVLFLQADSFEMFSPSHKNVTWNGGDIGELRRTELRLAPKLFNVALKANGLSPSFSLDANLFWDVTITVPLKNAIEKKPGFLTIYSDARERFLILGDNGKLLGSVRDGSLVYTFRPSGNGKNKIEVTEYETALWPEWDQETDEHNVDINQDLSTSPMANKDNSFTNSESQLSQVSDNLLVTVLVVFPGSHSVYCQSPDAAVNREIYARGTEESLELPFNYLDDHGIRVLAYVRCFAHYEYGSVGGDLGIVRADPIIAQARNEVQADMVSVSHSQAGGVAYYGYNGAGAANAYSTIWEVWAIDNYGFAHEMGHNMGLLHDFNNAGGGAGACNFGSYFIHPLETQEPRWRGWKKTVMSYGFACDDCPIWPVYSSPFFRVDNSGRTWGPFGFDCNDNRTINYPPIFGGNLAPARSHNQDNFLRNIKSVAEYRGPIQDWSPRFGCEEWDPDFGCRRS